MDHRIIMAQQDSFDHWNACYNHPSNTCFLRCSVEHSAVWTNWMADLQSELDNEFGSLFLRPGEVIENMKHVFSGVCVGGCWCVSVIYQDQTKITKRHAGRFTVKPLVFACCQSILWTLWPKRHSGRGGGRAANKTTVEWPTNSICISPPMPWDDWLSPYRPKYI